MALRSNPRNATGTGTRWQMCRSSLVSSPNVTYPSFRFFGLVSSPQTSPPVTRRLSFLPSFFPLVATYGSQRPRSNVITCGFGNHLLLLCAHSTLAYRNASAPFVAGKRTFSSLVSKVKAKVQEFENTRYAKIFTLFFSSTLFPLAAHGPATRIMPPRTKMARHISAVFTHSYHSLTSVPTSYRNAPNPSSSGAGPGTGTDVGYADYAGYAAQPPSPVLDRHAQQAYYAPRPIQSTPPQVQNIPPSGDNRAVNSSVPPSSSDENPVGVPPPPATNSGRPVSNNIDPGSAVLISVCAGCCFADVHLMS